MKNSQIIDKIKQLEKEFQSKSNCLKKMIIIHNLNVAHKIILTINSIILKLI